MDWLKGKLKPDSPVIHGKIYGFRLRFSLKPIHGYFPFPRPISAAKAPFVPREGSCCAAHGGRVSQTSAVHADNHGRLAKIGENGAEKNWQKWREKTHMFILFIYRWNCLQ